MCSTSPSLVQRLQAEDQAAWARFVHLYHPLLTEWAHRCARRFGLSGHDAEDLVNDVFLNLFPHLRGFKYDPQAGSFRRWLRTVMRNRACDLARRRNNQPATGQDSAVLETADPDGDDLLAEAEYRERLVARALQLMQTDFDPPTWQAFLAQRVEGERAADVARRLGLSEAAVYAAASRVVRLLRRELEGLL
jgi:RNA polymerase sigma-70 factor (ECF subfamily)